MPYLAATYTAILALMLVALSARVIQLRYIHQVVFGDGDNVQLTRAVRGQGNFTEYVPLALIAILCLELLGQSPWLIHATGGALVAGRIAHGICFGFCENAPRLRRAGMILTFAALIIGAVGILATVTSRVL
jgi:uncharacterized membrane protein YecN with MAPEG domain